jgi:hypothetical protein
MALDKTKEMNTICAISTPYGSGGIAVVRVSGAEAIAIADSLWHGRNPLSEAKAYTVHYGEILVAFREYFPCLFPLAVLLAGGGKSAHTADIEGVC